MPSRFSFQKCSLVAACAALAICLSSCSSSNSGSGGGGDATIDLVAYSTPASAYAKLISAFEKTPAGKGITVSTSFGASGTQAKDVVDGQPADVVNFSLEPDMAKLVKAGLVSSSWDTVGPDHGFVTDSVVVFVVRKGNPEHIQNWSDLIQPGIKVVTPNPFSSGSARWNIMAAYGAALATGDNPSGAQAYLKSLLQNTVAQPASASDAMESFLVGQRGRAARLRGRRDRRREKGRFDRLHRAAPDDPDPEPDRGTRQIHSQGGGAGVRQLPAFRSGAGTVGEAGIQARHRLCSAGRRRHVPDPERPLHDRLLGGWTKDAKSFFDPQTGIVAKIETSLGVSTSSG